MLHHTRGSKDLGLVCDPPRFFARFFANSVVIVKIINATSSPAPWITVVVKVAGQFLSLSAVPVWYVRRYDGDNTEK